MQADTRKPVDGPPVFSSIHHIAIPCRDLDEGISFYRDVLGGEQKVQESAFALLELGGILIGISTEGATQMVPGTEYPHFAFLVDAGALVQTKEWLTRCGIPSSDYWTRNGIETLLFFRDPTGNVIELFCPEGYEGANELPRGPARGHSAAINIDAITYSEWQLP